MLIISYLVINFYKGKKTKLKQLIKTASYLLIFMFKNIYAYFLRRKFAIVENKSVYLRHIYAELLINDKND